MRDEWQDPDFAAQWDRDPNNTNATRVEQTDIVVSLLAANHRPGDQILDIGMGSGLVEAAIFERIPSAFVVGIDNSRAMLELARKRLHPFTQRYAVVEHDLREIASVKLPASKFRFVISSQVLHELPHVHKREIFEFVHSILFPGGMFVLTDRVRMDPDHLYGAYSAMWQWVTDRTGQAPAASFAEFFEKYRTKEDHPATLQEEMAWLEAAGFVVAPLYFQLNRFILAAQVR